MDRRVIEIKSSLSARHAKEYLAKHQLAAPQIALPPPPEHRLTVVIPSYREPDICTTLDSLWRCERPDSGVEVIIVINASVSDDSEAHAQNSRTISEVQAWSTAHWDPLLRFHAIAFSELSTRHAGVGLARKLGMDEAIARFADGPDGEGVLLSLDADCTVDSNYLIAVDDHFRSKPRSLAANLYFEHDVDSDATTAGIMQYELHLRYYVHAMRYAGFPWAQHTVGSSFAVRSTGYVAQGGMNRRKAGEDFYFLQKLIPAGDFGVITSTCVRPSARGSSRVPFGTGRAIRQWQQAPGKALATYPPEIFVGLRQFFQNLDAYAEVPSDKVFSVTKLPDSLVLFLEQQGFVARHQEILANTASAGSFRGRLLRWFNAFRLMKYVRQASQESTLHPPVAVAAQTLLTWLGEVPSSDATLRQLLEHFRRRDRLDLWSDLHQPKVETPAES